MKLFFEAKKQRGENEEIFPDEIMRVEIENESEAQELKEKFKNLFDKFYIHYCKHDEGKQCKLKEI